MVSGNIFDVSASSFEDSLTIRLAFEHADWNPNEVNFTLTIEVGQTKTTANFKANPESTLLTATYSIATDTKTICLLGCVGTVVVQPMLECLNKDINQYITCLKNKGLSIAGKAVACAIECLA